MKLLNTGSMLILLFSISSFGYVNFPDSDTFRRNVINPEKDSFCPRLEGVYPAHCCPYKQNSPIQCFYYNTTAVTIGTTSSGVDCINGVSVQVTCCQRASIACISDLSQKTFIQRLVKRAYQDSNKCAFEACPYPAYWKNDNLQGRSVSKTKPTTATCDVVAQQDQCSGSSVPDCGNISACPAPIIPGPSEPAPSNPAPSNPTPSEPGPVVPGPSEPTPSEPAPSTPTPTEPSPVEPSIPAPEQPVAPGLG